MVPGKLYKSNRGLQTQAVGLLIKGDTASVQILGSCSMPATIDDMVDMTDAELLTKGAYQFTTLPQFIYFVGTADKIEVIDRNFVEVDLPNTWGN